MSSAPQQPNEDAQPRSLKMLQQINQYLRDQKLGHVVDLLPSYKEHRISLDNTDDPCLDLGYVVDDHEERLSLSIRGHSNRLQLKKKKNHPEKEMTFVKGYAMGKKEPFDWNTTLYEGLLEEPAITPFVSGVIQNLKSPSEVPNLVNLPHLKDVEIQECNHKSDNFLPLRLCIGNINRGKVWMYIEKGSTTRYPPCEIEIVHPERLETIPLKELKTKTIITDYGITLLEPFLTGKAGGEYTYPMFNIGRYYFFLAYQQKGLELKENDIHMNNGYARYLGNGVNAYTKAYPPSQSHIAQGEDKEMPYQSVQAAADPRYTITQPSPASHLFPTQSDKSENSKAIDAAQVTSNLQAGIGQPFPKTPLKQTLLSPTSPPEHEKGASSYEIVDDVAPPGSPNTPNLNQLRAQKNILGERHRGLQQQVQKHRNATYELEEELDDTTVALRDIDRKIQEVIGVEDIPDFGYNTISRETLRRWRVENRSKEFL
ncbi:uncharacterized protein N0V89_007957 [Didymosphaeria variabile]|uniref:Uncharacterized protein n=1 Tax=Didymosphaeria variabile TaxID=1932322 RepID=A0A9W9C8E8_9PLEO|nr:uncharacterized protein N0V89_007957 [Didymosphaeria variabile]KAJ4349343.1 hypothetical protein N0V89_007957 [Didymosphaeria variabile]